MNLKVEKFITEFETVYFVYSFSTMSESREEFYESMNVVSVNGFSGDSQDYNSYLEKKCDEFEEGIMELINSDGAEAIPYISGVFAKLNEIRAAYFETDVYSELYSASCPGIYCKNAKIHKKFHPLVIKDDEETKLNGHYLFLALNYLYAQRAILTRAIFTESAFLRIAANQKPDAKSASSDSDPTSPKMIWKGEAQLFFLIFSALKDLQYISTIGIKKDSLKSYGEALRHMIYVENPDKKGEEFTEDSFYQKMKASSQKDTKYGKAFEALKRMFSTLLSSYS